MKYHQVISLLKETGLSPESLAKRVSVSDSIYRRWLKAPPEEIFPKRYEKNIATAVYALLNENQLSYDSKNVARFLEENLPEYFQAAAGHGDSSQERHNHEGKIVAALTNLGKTARIRSEVDKSYAKIQKFTSWGDAWNEYISMLLTIIDDKRLPPADKSVAYGALYYLVLPFNLIPHSLPVFGYVDDFGILGFAATYYRKRFPS